MLLNNLKRHIVKRQSLCNTNLSSYFRQRIAVRENQTDFPLTYKGWGREKDSYIIRFFQWSLMENLSYKNGDLDVTDE